MDEATTNTLKMMQLMRSMFEEGVTFQEEASEIRNDEEDDEMDRMPELVYAPIEDDEEEQRLERMSEAVYAMIEEEAAEIRNDETEAIASLEELRTLIEVVDAMIQEEADDEMEDIALLQELMSIRRRTSRRIRAEGEKKQRSNQKRIR